MNRTILRLFYVLKYIFPFNTTIHVLFPSAISHSYNSLISIAPRVASFISLSLSVPLFQDYHNPILHVYFHSFCSAPPSQFHPHFQTSLFTATPPVLTLMRHRCRGRLHIFAEIVIRHLIPFYLSDIADSINYLTKLAPYEAV